MSVWDNNSFTENEFSRFGKALVTLFIVLPVLILTAANISSGRVSAPYAFATCVAGFGLFLSAKICLFRKGIFISFGTRHMSVRAANLYRLGYWMMLMGLIAAFSS